VSGDEMAIISMMAITNGALIQIIMVSRVLYGMSKRHMVPGPLGSVHPATRTPIIATLLTGLLVSVFSLWLPITTLAKTTSALILVVFTLVNIALLVMNCHEKNWNLLGLLLPAIGVLLCISFLCLQILN
jgi:basic amino acid/polyamine antiporter, APA family